MEVLDQLVKYLENNPENLKTAPGCKIMKIVVYLFTDTFLMRLCLFASYSNVVNIHVET